MASSEPNLHSTTGSLRHFLIAREGKVLVGVDYSSFEFRAIAGLSGEQRLIDALNLRDELEPQAKELCKTYEIEGKPILDPEDWIKAIISKKITLRNEDLDFAESFLSTDLHISNAAAMFHIKHLEVTSEQRRLCKTLRICTSLWRYRIYYTGFFG